MKQNRKPQACPSKAKQCLFVHPCACALFCISSEAAFPTDRRGRGGLLQHAGHDDSHPELLADKPNRPHCLPHLPARRIVTSQGYKLCMERSHSLGLDSEHSFLCFFPQQTGHSLSFPFCPTSSALRDSLKQGNSPWRRDCQRCLPVLSTSPPFPVLQMSTQLSQVGRHHRSLVHSWQSLDH